jgi:8-oxo-dGTP pyrophosphatase MutT (NUDIX family)
MKNLKLKREFSAGGIVFQKEGQRTLWLVVKPTGSQKWRFPKGGIEKGENSLQTAVREVKEEAGIEVEVLGKIGNEKYFFVQGKQKILKTVVFYLMKYLQEAESGFSWETEAIDWLPLVKAKERLAFAKEVALLEKAEELRKEAEKARQMKL